MRMIKGWSARHAVKLKPQQPDGCEDFGKTRNAAIRLFASSSIRLLINNRTLRHFTRRNLEIVVRRRIFQFHLACHLKVRIEEILLRHCAVERIETMQTIAFAISEAARVTLLAPEAIASLGMLHPPATDIPLGLVLERQFLAALAAHGEATRQAARALQSGSGEEALRLLAQVLTPEQLAQVQRELLGR